MHFPCENNVKNFFNEYRTLWAACWCTSFFRWNSPVFIRRWIYYSNVILYAAVHLKHATNYKLLQILTFSGHELLYSRYIWFSLHVYAFKSHMQGKNTHSCAHCTKCACPHLLNIVTKKYFYVLRRMEIHFIFHKFSGSFFVSVCMSVNVLRFTIVVITAAYIRYFFRYHRNFLYFCSNCSCRLL